MKKSKIKELKEIIKHFHGIDESSPHFKFWLRKYKKQYNLSNYNR